MKTRLIYLLTFSLTVFACGSQQNSTTSTSQTLRTTTTTVSSDLDSKNNSAEDMSDNLDLEAVSSIFGESKDLEDFEKRLNSPDSKISNLDLNKDGEVDYLRVVSSTKNKVQIVCIQALIAKDKYQDVATIKVSKDEQDVTTSQIIGDPYIYGAGYIINPYYDVIPPIYGWFWGPYFSPWFSPYYWGFYPPFFRPWRPFPPYIYHTNVRVHVNVRNSYRHTTINNHPNIKHNHNRNDFAKQHPEHNFQSRNPSMNNKRDLDMNRGATFSRSSFPTNFRMGGGRMGGGMRR